VPAAPFIALLERPLADVFARVRGRDVTAGDFLDAVQQLAARLPEAGHVFNLVRDRYAFTVAFAAVVAAGKVNLLPNNPKPAVLAQLGRRYERVAVLHDGLELPSGFESLALAASDPPRTTGARDIPVMPADAIAAVSFTSGSTGEAKPIAKTLGMFRGAVALYEHNLVPAQARTVATVPAQHMYGLELASLQAFWSHVQMTACKPLFPADVHKALADVDGPRVLITTPLHLRALVESGLAFPALERVLSATAPLDEGLARAAEDRLGAPVLDVYGCSEAGCMALRRASREQRLTPLPGLSFATGSGGETTVNATHLDLPVPLGDRLCFEDDGRFRLAGRLGDLINVAGKRGSLGEITCRLLEVPGVEDAVAFAPPGEDGGQRPAALYAGRAGRRAVRAHLLATLDDVFVPRPLIRVDRLPRTEASKLPRSALLALYRQHLRGQ